MAGLEGKEINIDDVVDSVNIFEGLSKKENKPYKGLLIVFSDGTKDLIFPRMRGRMDKIVQLAEKKQS